MNIISILVWAVIAYVVYLVLASIGLVVPWPTIVALLVFVLGAFGSPYIGGRRV